jgi:hypothetical protein
MATCPVCEHDVRTPFFLDLEGWSHLTCTQCKTRLEMKPPRSAAFAPVMAPLFVLARRGHFFAVIAFIYMFTILFLLLLESVRPKLRVRTKPLPKPEIRLNINDPSK